MRNREYRNDRAGVRRDTRAARVAAMIGEHPRESVALLMGTLATTIIFVNALFLQHGPHPAPIFATRPLAVAAPVAPKPRVIELNPAPASVAAPAAPVAPRTRAQIVTDIQRALASRGFYEGAVDGVWGAKTDAALRDFAQTTGIKGNLDANEETLRVISSAAVKSGKGATQSPARADPIAQLLAPSRRLLAIQHALSDFGYGQIKPTGIYGPETKVAIEKFERDHRLPVTGQVSDQLVRDLSAMTGRPLE